MKAMFRRAKRKTDSIRWHGKRKTLITLRWKRGFPRLIIHEKYESLVKWSLRALTAIGIGCSVVFLPAWYWSLLLAIILVAIEQFLERAVFLYTVFYVLPFPDFQWDISEEWIAMGFAFPVLQSESELNVAGPVFKSESCAHEVFELLRKWNYDNQVDRDDNICLSLITVDDGYFGFIYPNLERSVIKETFSEIEETEKLEKYGKEIQKFIVQFVVYKHFLYASDSMFNRFSQEQSEGQPYWLQPFIQNPNGSTRILFSEEPILKFHAKIRPRSELGRGEVEYWFFKHVIGQR